MKKNDSARTINSLIVFIVLYWLYIDFILSFFHIVKFDLLVAMGSQPLDFGWWICSFDNGADSSNLPALLESSSSSDSLATFRAQNPYEIYQRIQSLEARDYYNIPPQNNPGDYERLVRENLSRARALGDDDFYSTIYHREYFELRILERKGLLQDRLTNLMLNEHNIDRIMDMSPYSDVRKEAYHFIQDRFPPVNVNSLEYPLRLQQRIIMDENLNSINSFVTDLKENHSRSEFYQEFYRYFTDEEFRLANGLPLP